MKLSRKVIGWMLVAISGICALIGISPLREFKVESIFLSFIGFVAGAWVLVGPEVRGSLRHLIRAKIQERKPSPRAAGAKAAAVILIDPLLPVRILKLARERAGTLTIAGVAMELDVPLAQAQAGMDECVRMGNAVPDYDIPHGHALYRFPEFMSPDQNQLSH